MIRWLAVVAALALQLPRATPVRVLLGTELGRVVWGMDVVRRIQAAPVREKTQNLAPPIGILNARVLRTP
jgi:hypothetical protein